MCHDFMGEKRKIRVACVISGGKDGLYAFSRVRKAGSPYEVISLLNLYVDGDGVSFHQYHRKLVAMQARAIGLPLIQRKVVQQYDDQKRFESQLLRIMRSLKRSGIDGVVFGYILEGDYQDELLHRVCAKADIELILPNYKEDSREVLEGIIRSGIRAMVSAVDPGKLSDKWLGRTIDGLFVSAMSEENIDPCGDAGEYHSFVLDAPFFSERLVRNGEPLEIYDTETSLDGEVFRQRNLRLDGLVSVRKR